MRPSLLPADEPLMQIGRDDAELRSQLEDIPPVVAEHANRRRAVGRSERAVLVRQQPDEDRFPRAVGTDDGRVFAGGDGQREAVEDGAIVLDDGGVDEFQNGVSGHGRNDTRGQLQ